MEDGQDSKMEDVVCSDEEIGNTTRELRALFAPSVQVKSALTPVGEPNVRAEREKLYTPKITKNCTTYSIVTRRGSHVYMEQKSRKDDSRASLGTISFFFLGTSKTTGHLCLETRLTSTVTLSTSRKSR